MGHPFCLDVNPTYYIMHSLIIGFELMGLAATLIITTLSQKVTTNTMATAKWLTMVTKMFIYIPLVASFSNISGSEHMGQLKCLMLLSLMTSLK